MDRKKKTSRLLVMMMSVICMLLLHPITASAEEKLPGGVNNVVSIRSMRINKYGAKVIYALDVKIINDYEMVGWLVENGENTYDLHISYCKDGLLSNNRDAIGELSGIRTSTDTMGGISTIIYDTSNYDYAYPYQSTDDYWPTYECQAAGLKIFISREAVDAYVESGSLEGMINEDEVDSGIYDSDIGYLHDLKHHGLMYGERDENGIPEGIDDRFTWSDYYPEYDDSYLVEVRASYNATVRKWFGFGEKTVYTSDIRTIDTGIKYKDLEYIVSSSDVRSVFMDFIDEYVPNPGVTVGYSDVDAFYFRIYRWDEDDESYHYGKWVRLKFDEDSTDYVVDAGDLDDDGNWIPDPDSDYGKGKPGSNIVGSGDDQDEAKDDADQKQEDKDNGGKPLDLSDTNFKELWEWFTSSLYDLFTGLGAIPDFFGRLFSFFPSPVIGFLALGIVVAIILRVLGR